MTAPLHPEHPGTPLVLLPVRLETRYAKGPYDSWELLVRIYPDTAHVDSHERALTPAELRDGLRYWSDTAAAGPGTEEATGLWRALAAAHGPARAAWIARRTRTGPPAGDTAGDTWGRAPVARLLPTRWHLRGHYTNRWGMKTHWDVVTTPVRPDLAVGLNPAAAPPEVPEGTTPVDEGTTPVDEGMRWMVDFAAAEAAGMAVRVPRSKWEGTATSDRQPLSALYVVGVDETRAPDKGAADLSALFEAHYYTDGFGFLAPGTPTNNTGTERSGLVADAEERGERYRLADADPVPPGPHPTDTVAGALTRALGLGPAGAALFAKDPGGARVDHQHAAAAATWQAHLGYFLANVLRGVDTAATSAARRFYVDHVRPGGHLPVLRVGDQPYGVLPVVGSIPGYWDHTGVPNTVLRTLGVVGDAVGPHVRGGETGSADLVSVLATQPRSVSYEGRTLLGSEYLSHLWRFAQLELPSEWWKPFSLEYQIRMTALGLDQTAEPLFTGAYAAESFPVSVPFTGKGAGAALAALLQMDIPTLRAAEGGPLLLRLIRHAAFQELRNALTRYDGTRAHIEPEVVDLDVRRPPTATLWRALARPAPAGSGHATLGDFLADPATGHPATAELHEFRAAVAELAALGDEELTRLGKDALDTAAYRRDAWLTAVAAERVDTMRTAHPDGLLVGGFGWVFDLEPAAEPTPADPPEGETGEFWREPTNGGHIAAPSLHHATTAGILRAGYLARGGSAGDGAVAVNLEPRRAKLVRHLAEGVRAGQPLQALLGYRFERALGTEDPTTRAFAPAFRALAPSQAQVIDAEGGATEVTTASTTPDGLVLLRRHRAGQIPWGDRVDPADPATALPKRGTYEHQNCERALNVLVDAVDALADAGLAEAVHQLVGGNPVRAGAALDALAKGEAPVPDLDVLRTPRTGATQHHRLLFLAHVDEAHDVVVWPTDGRQVRAGLEPTVNAWAAALLGDPARVRAVGRFPGHDPVEVSVADLRLSPLDVLALARADRGHAADELVRRCTDALRAQRPADVSDSVMAQVSFDRLPSWGPQVLSVRELLTMAADVAALVSAARPARAADFAVAGDQPETVWETANQEAKVTSARTRLTAVRAELAAARAAGDIGGMGGALASLAAFGVPGAFPEIGRAWDEAWRAELAGIAEGALAEVDRRLAALAALDATGLAGEELAQHHVTRLRCLLGEDFPSVPTWRPAPAARPALGAMLGHSAALLSGDPLATGPWLDQLARVRPGAARLQAALAAAEATAAPATQALTVGQLPYADGDSWAALPGPSARAARTCVAVHTTRRVNLDASLAGLVIDEWSETVPGDKEVTGVAFHYDAPGARAPQAMLLAATSNPTAAWTIEAVHSAVAQADQAARTRTARQEDLALGHLLPALLYPFNTAGDTASTPFTAPAAPAAPRGVDA